MDIRWFIGGEMKIKITINLGNYENVTLESSEHETAIECVGELTATVSLFRDPHVEEYMRRVFGGV
jgi:hypothetical protein